MIESPLLGTDNVSGTDFVYIDARKSFFGS